MSHVNRNTATVRSTILSWQEALAIIEQCDARGVPIPFAIAFCTCDESKNTGGEIIRYPRAVWYVKGNRVQQSADHQHVSATGKAPARQSATARWVKRIRGVDSDQIRNVHLHLILEINGQSVR